jgi:hypothetical protein
VWGKKTNPAKQKQQDQKKDTKEAVSTKMEHGTMTQDVIQGEVKVTVRVSARWGWELRLHGENQRDRRQCGFS